LIGSLDPSASAPSLDNPVPRAARVNGRFPPGVRQNGFLCRRQIPLDEEQTQNYVRPSFREVTMFRAVVEEAAALTSVALFVGMIAIWAQVLSAL
jgi:hypothetical protein